MEKLSIVILTHNRLESLKRCIKSIEDNTTVDHEIIVVDNASSDGTLEWLESLPMYDEEKLIIYHNVVNEGVCARNYGFEMACKNNILVQVDDDVIVHKNWDTILLEPFNDEKVGMSGVQGGLIKKWLEMNVWENNSGYADFLTGYMMAFRNIGIYYDSRFQPFWHEELFLSLKFKEAGYKIKVVPMICTHVSQRKESVQWNIHDRNLKYVYDEWKDKQNILRLGGN